MSKWGEVGEGGDNMACGGGDMPVGSSDLMCMSGSGALPFVIGVGLHS